MTDFRKAQSSTTPYLPPSTKKYIVKPSLKKPFMKKIWLWLALVVAIPASAQAKTDRWGVAEIYPTVGGGREWFLPDDADLNSNREFVPETTDIKIVQKGTPTVYHTDGDLSYGGIRLDVHSPIGKAWWRDVEMTAYYRYTGTYGENPHWEMQVRGERHEDGQVVKGKVNDGISPPRGTATWPWWNYFKKTVLLNAHALGTAYHGNVYVQPDDGANALFEKELSHDSGYADQRGRRWVDNLAQENNWFGLKFVVRNNRARTAVKMELWLDRNADGRWENIDEYTDQNGIRKDWKASALDGTTQRPYYTAYNRLITWAGPWVTFRADNLNLDFKELSVREVGPFDAVNFKKKKKAPGSGAAGA